MKSLAELKAIKAKMQNKVQLRGVEDEDSVIRVVVGMATCGIAAGARPVLNKFIEEVQNRGLKNVVVTQTGEKTTYVKMTEEKAVKVVHEHIVNNKVVEEYTIANADK